MSSYKTVDKDRGLLIRDIRHNISTAGPSPLPNNERTEIFFLGCNKAMSGNPCKGCFNKTTWDSSKAEFGHDPVVLAKELNEHCPNKYITIGGGEPTDQINNLIILCKELKKYGFDIMVYTWRSLKEELSNKSNLSNSIKTLLKYIDIVVDGEYIEELNIYNKDKNDGLFNSVGSANQTMWIKTNGVFIGAKISNIEKDIIKI